MPSNNTSPHATSFKSAIKRGIPAGIAVDAIARRSSKRPSAVFSSLHKAGLCHRQKFNGQSVYWACEASKSTATVAKGLQLDFWQSYIDWCVASGHCTPDQLASKISSQQQFMSYCRKFFNSQFSASSSSSRNSTSSRGSTSTRSRSTAGRKAKRTTSTKRSIARKSRPTSYKFPQSGSTTRRLRRAA